MDITCLYCTHCHRMYVLMHISKYILIKGSLDEKLPIYERDPKSKRIDSFDKRFVREKIRLRIDSFDNRFVRGLIRKRIDL